jgi:hypothetical protein
MKILAFINLKIILISLYILFDSFVFFVVKIFYHEGTQSRVFGITKVNEGSSGIILLFAYA